VAELETAEELYDYCYDELIPAADGIARIEARDKAVALRAKRELLDEIRPLLERSGRNAAALDILRGKYQEKP
jgi:hypothetical protein